MPSPATPHTHQPVTGPTTWERAGRGLQVLAGSLTSISSSPPDGTATATWHTVRASDSIRIRHLLHEFIVTELECRPLRVLLGVTGRWHTGFPDRHQLLEEAARLVADRRLTLRERTRTGGSHGAMAAAEAGRAPARSLARTPAQLWRQQASNNVAAPAVVPVADPEFADIVEQDLQARVLRTASANGTPFCEVCEKARRAAARDQPAAEA